MRTVSLCFVIAFSALSSHAQPVLNRDTLTSLSGRDIPATALDRFLDREMEAAGIAGLSIAIIEDAQVVYHRAMGVTNTQTRDGVDAHTLFEAASLSKPLFAYFVMKQVDKGVIDLDTALHSYLPNPDIAFDERYEHITARMVLSHTSGLPNWRSDNPDGKLDIAFAPGTDYRYSGEGYQYLKTVLAHLLDTDDEGLEHLFQQEVAAPLGADRLYYTWNDAVAREKATGHFDGQPTNSGPQNNVGQFGAAYSLHTEARNYAAFLIAIMQQEGLREESWEEMLSMHFRFPPGHPGAEEGQLGWCLGFGIDSTAHGLMYSHGGNNGDFKAYAVFYRDHDYGAVLFANADNLFSSGFATKLGAFFDE